MEADEIHAQVLSVFELFDDDQSGFLDFVEVKEGLERFGVTLPMAELVRLSGQAVGHARPVVGLPNGLAMLQATLMSLMPGEPLMSAENVRSLSVDNVASPTDAGVPTLSAWGMQPSSVAAILPTYLQADGQAGSTRQRLVNLRGGLR